MDRTRFILQLLLYEFSIVVVQPFKRAPFGLQKDSFWHPKGPLLHCKCSPFTKQKDYIRNTACEHRFVTPILYVSYGEEFGLLTLEILVVGLYQFHVSLNIACRHNHVLALYELAFEVESVEQDWYVGLQCYEVETLLPFGIKRTGSLWSDTQSEVGSVAGSLC